MRYFWLVIGILVVTRVLIANYKWWFSTNKIKVNGTDAFLTLITSVLLFTFVMFGIIYLTVNYW